MAIGFDVIKKNRQSMLMYGGADAEVLLVCDQHLAGVVLDRFGHALQYMDAYDYRMNLG